MEEGMENMDVNGGQEALNDIVYTIRSRNIDEGLKAMLVSRGESIADMLTGLSSLLATALEAQAAQKGLKMTKSSQTVAYSEIQAVISETRKGLASLLKAESDYQLQYSTFVNKLLEKNPIKPK